MKSFTTNHRQSTPIILSLSIASLLAWPANSATIDFAKDVQPILELNCVSCHNPPHAHENGELDLSTKSAALKGGDHSNDVVPGDSDKSLVFKYVSLGADDKKLMPPKGRSGPLQAKEIEALRQWISEGAVWPDNLVLTNVMKVDFVRDVRPILEKGGPLSDSAIATLKLWLDQGAAWPADQKLGVDKEAALIADIEKAIKANSKETDASAMQKYNEPIRGTEVTFDMVPIPGGEFMMGSPALSRNESRDEGPAAQGENRTVLDGDAAKSPGTNTNSSCIPTGKPHGAKPVRTNAD